MLERSCGVCSPRNNAARLIVPGTHRRRISKRVSLACLAIGWLLLSSCDKTSPATARQSGALSGGGAPGAPAAAIRPAAAPRVSTPSIALQTPPSEAKKSSAPPVEAQESGSPVTATLRTDRAAVRAGEEFTVTVDVKIARGWHIYAIDRPTGPALATEIRLELPCSLQSAGKWTSPEPSLDDSSPGEPVFVHAGSVAFQCSLRAARGAAPGPIIVRCAFRYQACDRFSCRAPAEIELQSSIRVVP